MKAGCVTVALMDCSAADALWVCREPLSLSNTEWRSSVELVQFWTSYETSLIIRLE